MAERTALAAMTLPLRRPAPRTILAGIGAAIALGALVTLFGAILGHRLPAAEQASAIWGGLVLASFAGWGGALNARLFPRRRADLGLRIAWGWGITVALGGLLCALGLAGRRMLFALVWGGLLVAWTQGAGVLARWAGRPRPFLRRRRLRRLVADLPFLAGAAALLTLGGVQALASLIKPAFNVNDDPLAYFPFAREILDRGTLTQPFSLRRISAYGGTSVLDAIQLAIDVPETHLHLLDKGLGLVSVLALVLGQARASRRSGRALLLLVMSLVVALPDTGINSSSMRTAVVFFLGLYRTLTWAPIAEARGLRPALPVALLAAGACTLRQNFLVTIAAILVLAYATPIVRSLRLRPRVHDEAPLGRAGPWRVPLRVDRGAVIDAACTAGLLVLLLAPWWALAQRWCGTFLFPARKGFYNPAYSFFPSRQLGDTVRYIWANVSYGLPAKVAPLFLAAAVTIRDRTPRAPLAAVTWGSIVGYLGLLLGYPAADVLNQGRYHFGFTFAAVLAIALAAAEHAGHRATPGRARAAQVASATLVVTAISLQLYGERHATADAYRGFLDKVTRILPPWVVPGPDPAYRALQAPVPAGAPIATLVDNPSRFDHRRNRVACLDMIGAVSPPPGLPLARGGEAVAEYLLGQGYRYVVVVRPSAAASLYRRDIWQRQQKSSDPVWMASAHFYLEAFDAFDDLRATRVHLAEAGPMVTLDLAVRRP